MRNRKTSQIIVIVVCLLIAVFAGIVQAGNLKKAEPFSLESFFSEDGRW